MQEQDIQLAARCARLAEQSRHAATWLADNRETVGSECTTLQKEMRRAARSISVRFSMPAKMIATSTGPSANSAPITRAAQTAASWPAIATQRNWISVTSRIGSGAG